MIELVPPNLAKLGLPRKVAAPDADLITIWKTPYPVLGRYMDFCDELQLKRFGGGNYKEQGERVPGFITSGYRDEGLEGRTNSPHAFALALDIIIGDWEAQIRAAAIAVKHFERVGLYPYNGVIHVDLCPESWLKKYSGTGNHFWVRDSHLQYHAFSSLDAVVAKVHQLKG